MPNLKRYYGNNQRTFGPKFSNFLKNQQRINSYGRIFDTNIDFCRTLIKGDLVIWFLKITNQGPN